MDPKTWVVYRIESRPKDQGHGVLVRVHPDPSYDLTDPKTWNVQTGVYDYGGAAATVFSGTAYFSNYSLTDAQGKDQIDGKVYKVKDDGEPHLPTAITPGKSL